MLKLRRVKVHYNINLKQWQSPQIKSPKYCLQIKFRNWKAGQVFIQCFSKHWISVNTKGKNLCIQRVHTLVKKTEHKQRNLPPKKDCPYIRSRR